MRAKEVDFRDKDRVWYKHEGETWKEVFSRINWVSGTVLISTPLIALCGILFVPMVWQTIVWSVIYYFCTGFGITAGYHRLWSHCGYKAVWTVRFVLMLFGSGAAQGSIRWWCRNHRIHHRYTDTALDPYNARQGFFYSHFGWMLLTKDYSKLEKPRFDLSDLENDPMVKFQNKYYGTISLFMAFAFPTLVAGIGWGDWLGGYFFAAIARLVFVHHATFCVNSLAHWLGHQPFADDHTPRDHPFTALVTLGEGYHNFHHEFPQDYRNAIKWYQYDPTKWLINTLYYLGLAYDLQTFSKNEIDMGIWQIQSKHIETEKAKLSWGPPVESLPFIDVQEVKARVDAGEKLIIVDNFVHDVKDWIPQHPGGDIIEKYIGKDSTAEMSGTVYNHTQAARRTLSLHRMGRLAKQSMQVPN